MNRYNKPQPIRILLVDDELWRPLVILSVIRKRLSRRERQRSFKNQSITTSC
jgi:hypothetical protein